MISILACAGCSSRRHSRLAARYDREEIAGAVQWLCSHQASILTGQSLAVHCGVTAQ